MLCVCWQKLFKLYWLASNCVQRAEEPEMDFGHFYAGELSEEKLS